MTFFNGAQSIYFDPTLVSKSTTVDLAQVGMYFMYRPQATNNKSGINYPGITLFLTDVQNGVPNLANTQLYATACRAEWNTILTSSDASVETVFTFPSPITVQTGKTYAFCWTYDGGEDFLPWFNIKGNHLVGTSTISTGPSASYGGHYFTSLSDGTFTPLLDTDCKFNLYAARYSVNNVPILANLNSLPINTISMFSNLMIEYIGNSTVEVILPSPRMESIAFDIQTSTKQSYVGSQRAYQNTIHWPGGGVWASVVTTGSNTVTANSTLSNGASFSWNTVFGGYTGEKYVVLDYGTSVDVRLVTGIISNTVISVDESTTASRSNVQFMVTPVATVDSFNSTILNGKSTSLMFLRDSNANSTVKFTGHSVDFSNVTFSNTGTGYSNSDVLYVFGYQFVNNAITMNFPAVANLVTNSTGGVTSLNFSNIGCGFVNTAQVHFTVVNSSALTPNSASANSSAGANLVPIMSFSSKIKTEQTNNIFSNTRPINLDVHCAFAAMNLVSTANTEQSVNFSTIYYMATNPSTANGFITYVGNTQSYNLTTNSWLQLNQQQNIPVVVSRSLEFSTLYSSGSLNDQVNALNTYSNNFQISVATVSNNDWVALGPFSSPLIEFGKYMVNNDYTGENTDSGNSQARYITTVFNMTGPENTGQMAEDVRIYLSAWRPPGTDFQVFARIQNSTDSEVFKFEDWTRLQLLPGSNNFSTSGYVDLAYGFQNQPNSAITLGGTVSVANNTSVLVGSNTTWTNSLNNTLVKVYDPLFPNNNFAVVLVTNVNSNTSINVDQVFSTNTNFGIGGFSLTGRGGLLVDTITFDNQAFNNIQRENVVRYYNTSNHVYDGFNTLQVKCVMLTSDPHYIPRIHNIRGIGLSA